MIETEQSAEACPPLHVRRRAHRRRRAVEELVVESLAVALVMAVLDVLVNQATEVRLAQRDDATETLLFDRADKPFGVRVGVSSRLHRMRAVRHKRFR